ncbi:DUF6817 domain-containing protein [Micromonospora sagamiensis]|uniref:DUF6817 domain-containing protein n=1 Tax=Micromonospora sagamiensis TaxID=47875 RepID=A0A562WMI4_9ACTN|nr:hypothetical protein [Micromonospora sagamiensis]TWJ31412.1 hypothetical protein JD81_04968 [Micromonospora sagamiensis]BCL15542.1 hypothetical protein GCM10017556_32810 [Micromonospora sagamiensis]
MSHRDDVCAWLRERGTETIAHPGGTLYAHLCRVHDLLGTFGHGGDVRLAGLTHAAYGTDGFDLALLDPCDREPLRALVGADAEQLVYLYGACDRRRSWPDLVTTRHLVDRFTGRVETLAPELLRPFVDLSIVNELDVLVHDPTVARRYGDYFRSLFATWAPVASSGVTAETRRLLARSP